MLAAGPRDDGDRPRLRLRPSDAPPRRHGTPARRARAPASDAYLDAVVTETLRLRPVIDAVERTLAEAAHQSAAGTFRPGSGSIRRSRSCTAARTSTRRPREFRPERFLDADDSVVRVAALRRRHPPLHRRRPGAGRDGRGHPAPSLRASSWSRSEARTRPDRPDAAITLAPKHGTPVRVRARAAGAQPGRGPARASVVAARTPARAERLREQVALCVSQARV